jgi:hypothetical protein
VNARTHGGLAGSYGRADPAGWAHCSTCAGAVESTTMRTYNCIARCIARPKSRARLLQADNAWRVVQAADTSTGGRRLRHRG